MKLEEAQKIVDELLELLLSISHGMVAVAGSVRRQKEEVNDIDIIVLPKEPFMFEMTFITYLMDGTFKPMLKKDGKPMIGPKIKSVIYKGVQVDIYVAEPETWATLLLIRTGSKEHNIKLCTIAKEKGWKLHASGEGLFNEKRERIAGDTETSIFEALGLEYVPPEEREV